MFFSAPKSLCEAFKPLFYINWFMGLGIFLHPEKTVIPYFYILLQTVIINLTNWITIYVGLDELLQDTTDFNIDGQSMNRRNTYRVFHCINAGIVTIAPFLVWHRSKKAKESLRQMMILDDIFKYKLGLKHDYRKIHVYVNSRLIIVVLAMFTMAIYDLSWSLADHRSLFRNYCVSAAVHQPILVMFLLDLNFCTCVTYVEEKFRDLNDSLQGLARQPTIPQSRKMQSIISHNITNAIQWYREGNIQTHSSADSQRYMLQEIGKAHWELCKLANNINIVFGVQNLLFMVISVIVTTGLLYTIYVAYMLEDEMFNNLTAIIQPLAWTTIYIYKIWVINHSCGRATNEAQRTGEVIYGLMKPCAQDQELQTKIQEFSVQILQNPVQFDVCGFFIMNYTFIQAVIGYITTYLIILIQMTEAPKIQASNHSDMTPEVEQKNKVQ